MKDGFRKAERRGVVEAQQMGVPFQRTRPDGSIAQGLPGDYLVRNENDPKSERVVPKAVFEAGYVDLEDVEATKTEAKGRRAKRKAKDSDEVLRDANPAPPAKK